MSKQPNCNLLWHFLSLEGIDWCWSLKSLHDDMLSTASYVFSEIGILIFRLREHEIALNIFVVHKMWHDIMFGWGTELPNQRRRTFAIPSLNPSAMKKVLPLYFGCKGYLSKFVALCLVLRYVCVCTKHGWSETHPAWNFDRKQARTSEPEFGCIISRRSANWDAAGVNWVCKVWSLWADCVYLCRESVILILSASCTVRGRLFEDFGIPEQPLAYYEKIYLDG